MAANDVSREGKKILSRLLGVGILRTVVGDSRDQYQLILTLKSYYFLATHVFIQAYDFYFYFFLKKNPIYILFIFDFLEFPRCIGG